jgi:hypothetical protein
MNQSGEYLSESHLDAAEIPEKPVFGVKIEQTSKGCRVTVHVSTTDFKDSRMQSVELFKKVQQDLILEGIPLAGIEVSKNGLAKT